MEPAAGFQEGEERAEAALHYEASGDSVEGQGFVLAQAVALERGVTPDDVEVTGGAGQVEQGVQDFEGFRQAAIKGGEDMETAEEASDDVDELRRLADIAVNDEAQRPVEIQAEGYVAGGFGRRGPLGRALWMPALFGGKDGAIGVERGVNCVEAETAAVVTGGAHLIESLGK